MTKVLRAALQEIVTEAECQRLQLLKEAACCPEGRSGPQGLGFVLGLLMFYGRGFVRILELPHPDDVDPVVIRAMDVAGVGLMTFMKWQTAQTSLNAPAELDTLADCWNRLVILCGASSVG